MPGKIVNQLKEENKVSDFWFLVPLLGLTPCVFTALNRAFLIAKPKLRQIKFIDYLIEKLDFDQHDSVWIGTDYTYVAASGSITVKLSTGCKAGVSKLILAFYAETAVEMLKWELTTWEGSVRFLPPLETFVEWTRDDPGFAYDQLAMDTYKIDLKRFLRVTNKFIA